jgi:hypothetical protein
LPLPFAIDQEPCYSFKFADFDSRQVPVREAG